MHMIILSNHLIVVVNTNIVFLFQVRYNLLLGASVTFATFR